MAGFRCPPRTNVRSQVSIDGSSVLICPIQVIELSTKSGKESVSIIVDGRTGKVDHKNVRAMTRNWNRFDARIETLPSITRARARVSSRWTHDGASLLHPQSRSYCRARPARSHGTRLRLTAPDSVTLLETRSTDFQLYAVTSPSGQVLLRPYSGNPRLRSGLPTQYPRARGSVCRG